MNEVIIERSTPNRTYVGVGCNDNQLLFTDGRRKNEYDSTGVNVTITNSKLVIIFDIIGVRVITQIEDKNELIDRVAISIPVLCLSKKQRRRREKIIKYIRNYF